MLPTKEASTAAADGRANFKAHRVRQLEGGRSTAPASYTSNSAKEELCMEYVRQFVRQFMSKHPQRAEPFVIAENEHGVQKFVCTFISPTQNPYSELYDMQSCAAFFAGYAQYEPLREPTAPPSTLLSPTQLLEWHTGDAFDIAHLLCSCLLGAGYDAYVCYGTAPKHICLKDQSRMKCPFLDRVMQFPGEGKDEADEKAHDEKKENGGGSYCFEDDKINDSVYLAEESERKRNEAANHFTLWLEDGDDGRELDNEDDASLRSERLHAWVLVLPGKRDIGQAVFLEPATGHAHQLTSSCPFISWHATYNHKNYWINENIDCQIEHLDPQLKDGWVAMFVDPDTDEKQAEEDTEEKESGWSNHPDEGPSGDLVDRVLEVPRSWVGDVSVTRQQYQTRYPPEGSRMALYSKSSVDVFAKGTHTQGLVMRVTLFLDRERVRTKEVHEWFENRTDKLYRRSRYPLENKSHEFFRPGSVGEIKEWIEFSGRKRTVHFYVSGRLDRLKRREEDIGNKSMDFFEGRDDHLIYRSAVYTSENRDDTGLKTSYPVPSAGPTSELFVLKMTEKFSRNNKIPAKSDIAKRTFYCHDGRVLVHYHYEDGAITRATKLIMQSRAQSLAAAASTSASQDEVQQASVHERACWGQVKAMRAQMLQFAKLRRTAESHVMLEKNVFETARERVEKAGHSRVIDEKAKTSNAREVDYLTPFIRNVADPTMLTMAEAMEVRQACLDALKGRLLERANIIQSRLNDENNKLARKQEQFQRSQRDGDLTIEEYEKYCTDAMFRIQILEQRLVAHEEAAIKKYKDLDSKLQTDPRLAILHGGR